jgi:hypothetical protein
MINHNEMHDQANRAWLLDNSNKQLNSRAKTLAAVLLTLVAAVLLRAL